MKNFKKWFNENDITTPIQNPNGIMNAPMQNPQENPENFSQLNQITKMVQSGIITPQAADQMCAARKLPNWRFGLNKI